MAKNKTLLDFFTSPKSNVSKNSTEKKKTESPKPKSPRTPKQREKALNGSGSKSSAQNTPKGRGADMTEKENSSRKRRRLVIASDSEDSGEEYKPGKMDVESEDDLSSEIESEPEDVPVKKAKRSKQSSPRITKKPAKIAKTESSKVSAGSAENTPNSSSPEGSAEREWSHLALDWLKDDKIRDKKGRPKSHADYDPRTLYVPESFKKNATPAMKQWWDMKSEHFDTILFFKVGKFYELYHMDAVVAVNELGLIYMKGDFAHSGFPEIAYGRYSDLLVQKGYKVARVEQTETPQMMEERCRQMSKPTKFDRVVSREICQITTKGTRTFTCQDGKPMAADSSFLISLTEKVTEGVSGSETEYGICFIDTSVGKFYIGQFSDDRHCSRLRTLTAHYPPSELLYEKDVVSKKTIQMLNSSLGSVKRSPISTSSQFWDASKVLKLLVEKKYFSESSSDGDIIVWPDAIKEMLDEDDRLLETPKKEFELAVKALAACVFYLKECLIEEQLLTMKLFERYVPLDDMPLNKEKSFIRQNMVLDAVTLRNLEILENASTDIDGTLIQTIDFCSTNFGKRLLRQWLCSPLCNPKGINDRLDAVIDLENVSHVIDDIIPLLRKMPDLERLLSKIHTQGLLRSKDHPDSRAIFYEEEIYSKRKILDFLSTLEGFKCSCDIISKLEPFLADFKSTVLLQSVSLESNGGFFPDLQEALEYFDTAFDHEKAKKDGCIIPSKAVDAEYDSSVAAVEEINSLFDEYLAKQKRKFQCKVTYFGSGRNRFQLEVPDHAAKGAGHDYELQTQRKGFKRFYTDEIKDMLAKLTAAEDRRDASLLDIMRRIFAKFDQNYNVWKSAVQCLSVLDVLISLMQYKRTSQISMCRPELVIPEENTVAFLKIIDGRHPSMLKCFSGDNYIPNSVYLGPKQELKEDINKGGSVVLVTGPNMGGKSTLMRQTGLLVVLAQLGSYVPAEKCILTPVDRIFTRLGASDQITAGESTFFVEVSETSCILQHATSESLVLIDELGRGTSTYDGTAIACSVVKELASRISCRTLFSTHYHSLVEEFATSQNVGLGHMACMVEDDDNHPALESITFLYKFMEGVCPKSYGFNVAHLAGIPDQVVQNGFQKAKDVEKSVKYKKMCWDLLSADCSDILTLLQAAKKLVSQYQK